MLAVIGLIFIYLTIAGAIAWAAGRWDWWSPAVADIAALFWIFLPLFWLGGHALDILSNIHQDGQDVRMEHSFKPKKVNDDVTN